MYYKTRPEGNDLEWDAADNLVQRVTSGTVVWGRRSQTWKLVSNVTSFSHNLTCLSCNLTFFSQCAQRTNCSELRLRVKHRSRESGAYTAFFWPDPLHELCVCWDGAFLETSRWSSWMRGRCVGERSGEGEGRSVYPQNGEGASSPLAFETKH